MKSVDFIHYYYWYDILHRTLLYSYNTLSNLQGENERKKKILAEFPILFFFPLLSIDVWVGRFSLSHSILSAEEGKEEEDEDKVSGPRKYNFFLRDQLSRSPIFLRKRNKNVESRERSQSKYGEGLSSLFACVSTRIITTRV